MPVSMFVSSRPSSTIRPFFIEFASSPAMRRSSVLFPAPEGPKTTLHGAVRRQVISSWYAPRLACSEISSKRTSAGGPSHGIDCDQRGEAQGQKQTSCPIGGVVIEVLHLVVEDDRQCTRG